MDVKELLARAVHEAAAVGAMPNSVMYSSSGGSVTFTSRTVKNAPDAAPMAGDAAASDGASGEPGGGKLQVAIAEAGSEAPGGFPAAAPEGGQAMPLKPALTEPDAPDAAETIKPLIDSFDLVRTTPDGYEANGVTLARGSMFTAQDAARGAPVLVLGAELARLMFGDQDPLGKRFKANGILYTVIGILGPAPRNGSRKYDIDNWAFAPFGQPAMSVGGKSFSLPLRVGNLTAAVKDTSTLRTAVAQLTNYIDAHYGQDAFVIRSYLLEAERDRANNNRLLIVVCFLAASALLISSISLFNLMTIRTMRRARSIGIFRSFGANRRDIFAVFLGESLLLTVIGGAIGSVLAPMLYGLLSARLVPAGWGTGAGSSVSLPAMILTPIAAVLLNLLFAVFPARQASRTDIVDSIRAE